MIDSKLIQLLQSLSTREISSFISFCQSPYYNINAKIPELAIYLESSHPNYSSENIDKKKIFSALYPKEKFDDKKLRYVFSDLTALLEQYYMQKGFEENKQEQEHTLLSKLLEKKQPKYFLQQIKKTHVDIESASMRDSNY